MSATAVDPRGLKRICMNCGARFYDLNKRPIKCPSCETEFDGEIKVKARRGRLAAIEKEIPEDVEEVKKKPIVNEDDDDIIEDDDGVEVISLDDAEDDNSDDDDDAAILGDDDDLDDIPDLDEDLDDDMDDDTLLDPDDD